MKAGHTDVYENNFNGTVDTRTKVLMFGVSALLHAVLFLALVSMPDFGSYRRQPLSAITVSLVSLPGPGGGGASPPAPAPTPEPPPAPAPVAEPPPQVEAAPEPPVSETVSAPEPSPEAVSIAPKAPTPVKQSLKKKTKTGKKLAVKKVPPKKPKPKPAEKTVSRSSSVTKAIAALKNQVASEESQQGAGAGAGTGAGTGGGPGGMRRIDMYRIEVALAVERNWAFSEHLAGGARDLETLIVFRVLPNGEIVDFEYIQKSGNRYMDESAYKAVMKSNPVSPHPDGLRMRTVEVPLRFTPSGIR